MKTCKNCEKDFEPRQVYCCAACRLAYFRNGSVSKEHKVKRKRINNKDIETEALHNETEAFQVETQALPSETQALQNPAKVERIERAQVVKQEVAKQIEDAHSDTRVDMAAVRARIFGSKRCKHGKLICGTCN